LPTAALMRTHNYVLTHLQNPPLRWLRTNRSTSRLHPFLASRNSLAARNALAIRPCHPVACTPIGTYMGNRT
jgi:hypothetical protein